MWPNPQETGDLVTFTEEILNRKLHFCAVIVTTVAEKKGYSFLNKYEKEELKFLVLSCKKKNGDTAFSNL